MRSNPFRAVDEDSKTQAERCLPCGGTGRRANVFLTRDGTTATWSIQIAPRNSGTPVCTFCRGLGYQIVRTQET